MVLVFFVPAFFGRNKLILTEKIKTTKNTKNKRYLAERERERERERYKERGRER
jgi:hypothetical protein